VEEFPHLMIYSLPAPIRLDRPLDHEAVKQTICDGLRKLESTGADFIALPCNTAHIYFDELAQCIHAPLLNMIDETIKAIPAGTKKVALFATHMTVEAGLYQRGIEQAGLELILKESWQEKVTELITTIISSAANLSPQKQWDQLVAEVKVAGVDAILLGCTDLNVVSQRIPEGILLLDATQCLAQAVVRRYRESLTH